MVITVDKLSDAPLYLQLRDAVIAHPTMSEGLNIVLDSLG